MESVCEICMQSVCVVCRQSVHNVLQALCHAGAFPSVPTAYCARYRAS